MELCSRLLRTKSSQKSCRVERVQKKKKTKNPPSDVNFIGVQHKIKWRKKNAETAHRPTPHATHCMRTSACNNDDNDNDIWPVLVTVYRRVTRTDKRETWGKGKRPPLAKVPHTNARVSRMASGIVGFIISLSLHPSLFFLCSPSRQRTVVVYDKIFFVRRMVGGS